MPVQRLRIRLLLPVHGGILFPPLPGRQAVALLEGLGEVELVGVAAAGGDLADGGAGGAHHLRRPGQAQADDKFLGRTAHALVEKLAEIAAVELAYIRNLLHRNAPVAVLLDEGHCLLHVKVPQRTALAVPPGGGGLHQLIQEKAQVPNQMERRGIQTEKGNINREIAADNKLLKEIKARITRLYNWSKEQSTQPQGRESIMDFLFQARQDTAPTSRYGKVKALKADAKLFNFLMENGIKSMQELFDKVAAMNGDYYDLRGKIVSKERRISALTERLEMWAQYQKYKPVRQKLDKVAPAKREQFEQRHSADLALFDAAVRYLDTLKTSGESITPKAWRAEAAKLTAEKDADYLKMRAMREDIKAVETLKKTAERLAREGQTQRREEQER